MEQKAAEKKDTKGITLGNCTAVVRIQQSMIPYTKERHPVQMTNGAVRCRKSGG